MRTIKAGRKLHFFEDGIAECDLGLSHLLTMKSEGASGEASMWNRTGMDSGLAVGIIVAQLKALHYDEMFEGFQEVWAYRIY